AHALPQSVDGPGEFFSRGDGQRQARRRRGVVPPHGLGIQSARHDVSTAVGIEARARMDVRAGAAAGQGARRRRAQAPRDYTRSPEERFRMRGRSSTTTALSASGEPSAYPAIIKTVAKWSGSSYV